MLECEGCGLRLENGAAVRWLGSTWDDRKPYCLNCAVSEERRLRRAGI